MYNQLQHELKGSKISAKRKLFLSLKFWCLYLSQTQKYWSRTTGRLENLRGEEGKILRRVFYRKYFKELGDNVSIDTNVTFYHPGNIVLGDNVQINQYGYFNGHSGIKVAERVLFGPYVMVHSANHVIEAKKRIYESGYEGKEIVIEKDSLISGHCSVLAGVKLGEGSVLAAGAVATKEIPPYSIFGGVPAVLIKKRDGK